MSWFGDLLKIVAIGAFFIATGPFGLSVAPWLSTALTVGGVVLGYLGALIDRPKMFNTPPLSQRQASLAAMSLEPGTPLPVVYGRGKVGAVVADWFLNPTNIKQLYVVPAFCHG